MLTKGFSLLIYPPVRTSWEEYSLDIARAASERSEDPFVKVGACALSHDNMVLGVGYNGLASGKNPPEDFWEDRDKRRPFMIHAEMNCLSLFKKGEARLMAVTLLPCSHCAASICAYGIKAVVYGKTYEQDKKALEIFKFYSVELIKL